MLIQNHVITSYYWHVLLLYNANHAFLYQQSILYEKHERDRINYDKLRVENIRNERKRKDNPIIFKVSINLNTVKTIKIRTRYWKGRVNFHY